MRGAKALPYVWEFCLKLLMEPFSGFCLCCWYNIVKEPPLGEFFWYKSPVYLKLFLGFLLFVQQTVDYPLPQFTDGLFHYQILKTDEFHFLPSFFWLKCQFVTKDSILDQESELGLKVQDWLSYPLHYTF